MTSNKLDFRKTTSSKASSIKAVKDVAVLLLVNNYNEFLISKRCKDSFKGGYYELPGGKSEANETLLQTIQREIKEETAYELRDAELIYETKVTYDFGTFPLHVFFAKIDSACIPPTVMANVKDKERPNFPALEAESLSWVSLSQARQLKLLPILSEMLASQLFQQLLSADNSLENI